MPNRKLVLKECLSFSVHNDVFRKDIPKEVISAQLTSRLVSTGNFEESPHLVLHQLVSSHPQGRETFVIDDLIYSITAHDPTVVSRRVYKKIQALSGTVHRLSLYDIIKRVTKDGDGLAVLIIRDTGVGDVIITTDYVHNLKLLFPKLQVDFATQSANVDVLKTNPDIRKVWDFCDGELDAGNYLASVDFSGTFEEHPYYKEYARQDIPFVRECTPVVKHKTIYVVTPEETDWALNYAAECGMGRLLITFQPNASGIHRSFHTDQIPSIIEGLSKIGSVISLGPKPLGVKCHNFFDPFETTFLNLRQMVALISVSDILVCPDSSGYHFSQALENPVKSVVLFTVIHPSHRCCYYPEVYPIAPYDLNCFPCWDRPCGSLHCTKAITSDVVCSEVRAILDGKPSTSLNMERPKFGTVIA